MEKKLNRMNNFQTIREAEQKSKKKIRKGTFNWLNSAAEDGLTHKKNIKDLSDIKIIPKILKFSKKHPLNIKQKIFGINFDFPIILCPMGHQTQFESNGELSTARGSSNAGIPAFFSTQGRIGFDYLKKKIPKSNFAWQIFPFGDKKWIENEIRRAEKNQSFALSFCFDAPVRSHRYLDRESGYDARKYGKRIYPVSPDASMALNYDWDFLKWVKNKTKLKIIPKGLVDVDDIKRCIKFKCDGIWISNHGGRMFNSGISSVDIMKNIRKVERKIPIIVDGGVKKGTDIIKYLCLGANIVGVGRAAIYGLICEGDKGVSKIFNILKSELTTSMLNGGFRNLSDMKINRLILND